MKDKLKSYVSPKEILRYLQHKDQVIPVEMQALIDEVLAETIETIKPKYSLKRLPVHLNSPLISVTSESGLLLYQLSSSDLCEVTNGSEYFFFVAATLGYEVVRKINALMHLAPTKAIIMDACASVIADALCDFVQDELRNPHLNVDIETYNYFSQRYSPGYGNLEIKTQKMISDLLNTEKTLGVHVTDHYQLQPEKSVFFIIGTAKEPFRSKLKTCGSDCSGCLLKNCPYREA